MHGLLAASLVLVSLAACDLDRIFGGGKRRKPSGTFSIACDPTTVRLPRGSTGTMSCTIQSSNDFQSSVNLAPEGLPAGVSFGISPASVAPPKNGTVTTWVQINIESSVPIGMHEWRIRGSAGGKEASALGQIGVTDNTARVRVVYLVPQDRAELPGKAARIEAAIRNVQIWYLNNLAEGRSFTIAYPVVHVYRTDHPASWYSGRVAGVEERYWFNNNVVADGFRYVQSQFGTAARADPMNVWVFYVDARAAARQDENVGGNYVAIVGGAYLDSLGKARPDGSCPAVGALGHELGHAFFMWHPPTSCPGGKPCPIMGDGSGEYPNATLTPADRDSIHRRASALFQPVAITSNLFSPCS